MRRRFRSVPGPFDCGIDEQATQDAFVEYVGGRERAERLDSIWKNSYPGTSVFWAKPAISKRGVFRKKAKREGFRDCHIDAFLTL